MGNKKLQTIGLSGKRAQVSATLAGTALLLAVGSAKANSNAYNYYNLGFVGDDTVSFGSGINNNSNPEVVGNSGEGPQAAFSNGGANLQSFASGASQPSAAYAVNDGGIATGFYTPSATTLAFSSNTNTVNPAFNPLPTSVNGVASALAGSFGNGINGNAATFEIVGQVQYAGSSSTGSAFLWHNGDAGLTPLDPTTGSANGLGDTSAGQFSSANGLNAAGKVVGDATNSTSAQHAFLYDPSASSTNKMFDLGTASGSGISIATAINASGLIVGTTDADVDSGEYNRAFIYSGYSTSSFTGPTSDQQLTGTFTVLGSLDGTNSEALGINTAGDVVGDSAGHAVLYLPGDPTPEDLNSLVTLPAGVTLDAATGINDAGAITGFADDGTTDFAFLLTPETAVPEPATAGLVLAPVVIAMLRRRKK